MRPGMSVAPKQRGFTKRCSTLLVSARKPPFRAEICANSWHSGGDVGANRVATKAPDGLRASEGQYVARMSCFKGQ